MRRWSRRSAHRLASRLSHPDFPGDLIRQNFLELAARDPSLAAAIRADILAVADRDPACKRLIEPLLYFKGFHALQTHRLAHWLWNAGRKDFALYLQSRSSSVFQTDINPAARIGKGIFLDHATGLVVGATAVIEDDVSILHSVTLGGTGQERGDRHPKIRHGVLIGAGAKIIGNIEIGHCSRIAAGSVVLKTVPANVRSRACRHASSAPPAARNRPAKWIRFSRQRRRRNKPPVFRVRFCGPLRSARLFGKPALETCGRRRALDKSELRKLQEFLRNPSARRAQGRAGPEGHRPGRRHLRRARAGQDRGG